MKRQGSEIETVSAVMPVTFDGRSYFLLVFNQEELRKDNSRKPAGLGMPSGGRKIDPATGEFRSPDVSVVEEVYQETGVGVWPNPLRLEPPHVEESFSVLAEPGGRHENILVLPHLRDEAMRKAEEARAAGKIVVHRVRHSFLVRPYEWEKSSAFALFSRHIADLREDGRPKFATSDGDILIRFGDLPEEEVDSLGIIESRAKDGKRREIDGLALVQPRTILLSHPKFGQSALFEPREGDAEAFSALEESRAAANRLGIYPSHKHTLARGLWFALSHEGW